MSDNRSQSLVLPALLGVAVMVGLYAGVYYATVEPFPYPAHNVWLPAYRYWKANRSFAERKEQLAIVFAPMHWLDRRVRPKVWDVPIPIGQ